MADFRRLTLYLDPGEVKAIDEWRRLQPELASRNRAIRVLLMKGLMVEGLGRAAAEGDEEAK